MSGLSGMVAFAGLAAAGVVAHELRDRNLHSRLSTVSVRDLGLRGRKGADIRAGTKAESGTEGAAECAQARGPNASPRASTHDVLSDRASEYLAGTLGGLGLALGGLAVPVLGPLSVVPTAYCATPYVKVAARRLVQKREISCDLMDSTLMVSLLALQSPLLLAAGPASPRPTPRPSA